MRACDHNLELRYLLYFENVIRVFITAFAAYLACWLVLRIDLNDSVPSHGNNFRTLVITVNANYIRHFLEFFFGLLFFFLIIFGEVMKHGPVTKVPHLDCSANTGSD